MKQEQLLLAYCLGVIASSLLGGVIPSLMKLTHVRMQCLLSLVGGFVLGIALLHMIPHGYAACGALDVVVQSALVGLLVTFFLIRIFHFHQHGPEAQPGDDGLECSDPSHNHHHHDHSGGTVSLGGVLFGLSVHSLMDGIALGAAVAADYGHGHGNLAGFGVFLAVLLHKPLDALSVTGLMATGSSTAKSRAIVNFCYALICPIGALLFVQFAQRSTTGNLPQLQGIVLGFSAGAFLCISLSDLLPEVQFHRHDRGKLSVALLLGILLAYGIGYLEGEHSHVHGASNTASEGQNPSSLKHDTGHDHSGHDHSSHDH